MQRETLQNRVGASTLSGTVYPASFHRRSRSASPFLPSSSSLRSSSNRWAYRAPSPTSAGPRSVYPRHHSPLRAGGRSSAASSASSATATRAATLYLQRHLQLAAEHNAMGGRPLTLHHNDDHNETELSLKARPNTDEDNTLLRRAHILQANQRDAKANLFAPAKTSTSQGGIGGIWAATAANNNSGAAHPSQASLSTHNGRSSAGTSPATPSLRLRSPMRRRNRERLFVSKL